MMMLTLLWSINDRLGGGSGETMDRPNLDWVDDLLTIASLEYEESKSAGKEDDDEWTEIG